MKTLLQVSLLLLLAASCTEWKSKKVTITRDYVINPNWDEVDNSFSVYKMKPKDSSKTIDINHPTHMELYHGLIEDTSFSYTANIEHNGVDYAKRKVYFNHYNGFLWWGDPHKSSSTKETLGPLQQGTWYLLAGLSQFKTLYYVHLDSSDSLHIHKVSGMTNY